VLDVDLRPADEGARISEEAAIRHALRSCPLLLLAVLAGCGGHSAAKHRSQPAAVCLPAARDAMAGFLGVAPGAVATRVSRGNNTYLQCTFTVRPATGGRVVVLVNNDTGPQPYFVLERTAVEAAQVFTATRTIPAPLPVKLGLDAYWFPYETQLMTTDGVRLITATVTWRHASQRRMRELSIPVARPYLRPPRPSKANGFPSG
jgi:hypothetical protein